MLSNSAYRVVTFIHDWSGLIFVSLILSHLILHWKWMAQNTKIFFLKLIKMEFNKKSKRVGRKFKNYVVDIGMAIAFILVLLTGLLKFPLVFTNLYQVYLFSGILTIIHEWSGPILGLLILVHLSIHWRWIASKTKKILQTPLNKKLFITTIFLSILVIPISIFMTPYGASEEYIVIDGVGRFEFEPEKIETKRSDIFEGDHFSIFDILVYLDDKGDIDMKYHFDDDMNTYEIDSINGKTNWWHMAYYDGGWEEDNVFRIDHYPYKPLMYIRLFQVDSDKIKKIYKTYEKEIDRIEQNNGSIIIPEVTIEFEDGDKEEFENVNVTAHNLRDDFLEKGVITAIDVIMSLGDQGLIDYELEYYETIGGSEVETYYVEEINDDKTEGRCGFVYEEGDEDFKGFTGNHIHIPSDIRVINSPEYVKWFWICV